MQKTHDEIGSWLTYTDKVDDKKYASINRSNDSYWDRTFFPGPTRGPIGYEASKELEELCINISDQITILRESIATNMDAAEDIEAVLYDTEGKCGKQARMVMKSSINSYQSAFPESEINVDMRNKVENTIGISALAGIVAGLGAYFISMKIMYG